MVFTTHQTEYWEQEDLKNERYNYHSRIAEIMGDTYPYTVDVDQLDLSPKALSMGIMDYTFTPKMKEMDKAIEAGETIRDNLDYVFKK
jgi:hypothetical protein